MPVSRSVWGAPGALSVIVRVPERTPISEDAKVTRILQAEPGSTPEPQSEEAAKSPVEEMSAIVKGAVPMLVRLTD